MMQKKNTTLLLIFLGLLSLYGVSKVIIDARKKAVRSLIDGELSKARALRVFNGVKETSLVNDGTAWKFVSPYKDAAVNKDDIEKFRKVFVKFLIIKDLGKKDIKEAAAYGITDKSPRMELEFERTREELVLGMRNPVAPQNYLYRKDTGKLVLVDAGVNLLFSIRPEDLRGNRVFNFKRDEILGLRLRGRSGAETSLLKEGKDWYVKRGAEEYLCNRQKIEALMGGVLRLEIEDFGPSDDKMPLAKCGLTPPALTFTVTLTSGVSTTLSLGGRYGAGRVYAAAEKGLLGGIDAAFLKTLSASATNYAVEDIFDFPPAAASSFSVKDGELEYVCTKRRGKWYKTVKKERLLEEDKVALFFNALVNLRVEKYYSGNEIGEVKKELIFYGPKDEVLCDLLIGPGTDEFTRLKFKDKRGVFGVASALAQLLAL